jgi:hypothetical protein
MRWVCMVGKRGKGQIHTILPDAVSASVRKNADKRQERMKVYFLSAISINSFRTFG